jgi:hypothetical protein
MSNVAVVAGYGFREAVRRKVFAVVLVLTVAFLVLFWLANHYVFADLANIQPPRDVFVDTRTFAGSFLVGLAMFAALFLGVVLAVFLTLGVVTGDAERGLLQPLVVRPVGRPTLLLSRFAGASLVCVGYVLAVYFLAVCIVGLTGRFWPDVVVWPGVELAGGVVIVTGVSCLGSVHPLRHPVHTPLGSLVERHELEEPLPLCRATRRAGKPLVQLEHLLSRVPTWKAEELGEIPERRPCGAAPGSGPSHLGRTTASANEAYEDLDERRLPSPVRPQ